MRDTAFELFCEVQLYQSVGIQMTVLEYTSFLNALGVLIPHTDGLAELTPKNACAAWRADVVGVQRGEANELKNACVSTGR